MQSSDNSSPLCLIEDYSGAVAALTGLTSRILLATICTELHASPSLLQQFLHVFYRIYASKVYRTESPSFRPTLSKPNLSNLRRKSRKPQT